ncbi:beta-lactamase family protein [Chloroflexota bacterium]|nr:beta-lactamase family protein [Chloroflexota bacterium]
MLKRKKYSGVTLILSLLLVSILSPWSPRQVHAVGEFVDIDNYLASAMQRYNIPGMAVAITQGDNISFSKGYGTAGSGRNVTPDTPFYIGSQSKSFTALAIMQLVEQGKLDLDTPVQTYLPWFRVADSQASQQITIRHLLQHTSGLSESSYVSTLPPEATLEMLVRDLSRAELSTPVGTKMQYFNPGYSTLGLIVETVSGKSYGDYLRDNIFTPLKMTSTFTDPISAKAAGLAQGFSQVFMLAIPLDQPFIHYDLPAGYIISSANDMARYLMALVNGGELESVRVLNPENVEMIFTPNTAIQSTYGFGWFISEVAGETKIFHGGDTERFHTSVLILPESNKCFVMLINGNHLLKDFNEYDSMFKGLSAILTDNPIPKASLSSVLIGWGLFLLWILVLVLAIRKFVLLPKSWAKMRALDTRHRWMSILSHILSISITLLVVVVIAPAFLNRGFSWRWFVGFLPDIAIIVGTLVLDDLLQLLMKIWIMAKLKMTRLTN